MSAYPQARFLKSANRVKQFPPDRGVEVAFAGRSNSGKSSAINAITNRRGFARTSRTPGRTQLLNFFELEPGRRLVDLPGYGYARVAASRRDHWLKLLDAYFGSRRSLTGLFLLMDVRRTPNVEDRKLLEWAAAVGCPVRVLLTKADKLGRGAAAAALKSTGSELRGLAEVQLISTVDRRGIEEARAAMERYLDAGQKRTPVPATGENTGG